MYAITRRDFIQGLAALIGVTAANQFVGQLGSIARALAAPQEWVLSFDEAELERLIKGGVRVDGSYVNGHGCFALTGEIVFEPADLWQLATLTAPDGNEWHTTDGENWTCGDRRMVL